MNTNYSLTLLLFIGPIQKSWQHQTLIQGGDKADITHVQLHKFLLKFFKKNYYMIKTNFGSFYITLSKVWIEAKHLDIFFSPFEVVNW